MTTFDSSILLDHMVINARFQMDEAATLFLRQGYAETSLRHIARAAGMQAGSVYYHFESKDEILEEMHAKRKDPARKTDAPDEENGD